jgi:tRNA-2-methylthio-N6-dimethylallyladenosine synthase
MKRYFLETYGCQMNVYDAEGMERVLVEDGYQRAERPEDADLLLVHTCSVREHAEERALNRLSEFAHLKEQRPEILVGASGCMAQRMGGAIRRRIPKIDLVIGAQALPSLLPGIAHAESRKGHVRPGAYLAPPVLEETLPAPLPPQPASRLRAFVTIIRGCNKRCAYCIVPTTRGPEVSRTPEEIVDEVAGLVDAGVVELMLLGQNVNSYAYGGVDFPELLHRVGAVPGLRRLRFTTSHPRDMNREVIGRIATAPRLQPWMHLPVQSGSERVLSDMSREYSLDHYRGVVEAARAAVPDLALTTDIIVGFPGETEADFDATVRLLEEIRYDALYAFKYSPRSGTAAAEREDAISEAEKQRRLSSLLALQRTISHERNQRFVGRELETLVEQHDEKRAQWLSRTGQNKTLILAEAPLAIGTIIRAHVERAEGQTLYGRAVAGARAEGGSA